MATEHEHKFVIHSIPKKYLTNPVSIRQGYLHAVFQANTRIRIKGDKGFLTIKGIRKGLTRKEFEYEIPLADAEDMLTSFVAPNRQIHKTRYRYEFEGQTLEIDVFEGANKGLILAELELSDPNQSYRLPDDWQFTVATGNSPYYNEALSQNPLSDMKMKPVCRIV